MGHADTIGTVNLARGHQTRQRLRPTRAFVLEPTETLRRRLLRGECYCQNRRVVIARQKPFSDPQRPQTTLNEEVRQEQATSY